MNRKMVFSLVIAISVIALGACTTATPLASNNTSPTISTNNNTTSTSSTLACSNGSTSANLTPELTEGPYFKANSPERTSLLTDGMTGTQLVITGYVYDTNCQPVANALLDFWQADANGVYDNSGYTLRGRQFTDANGAYTLTTVVPGLYPGRTEHIHFKVQAPNGKILTSQLFFPGVVQNDSDGIFNESLLLPIQKTSTEWEAQFNFVVSAK